MALVSIWLYINIIRPLRYERVYLPPLNKWQIHPFLSNVTIYVLLTVFIATGMILGGSCASGWCLSVPSRPIQAIGTVILSEAANVRIFKSTKLSSFTYNTIESYVTTTSNKLTKYRIIKCRRVTLEKFSRIFDTDINRYGYQTIYWLG